MKQHVPIRLSRTEGFSLVEVLLIVIVIAGLGLGGWYIYHRDHKKPVATTTSSQSSTGSKATAGSSAPNPYAGWKTAKSPRAAFSIKYPASWSYTETVGKNDNVEHIEIDSSNFLLSIDSYSGSDPYSGGTTGTTCADCLQTVASAPVSITNLGAAELDVITYKVDSGVGNALILRQANNIYYIPSTNVEGVTTTFRGISNLPSEAAYQQESSGQFKNNPDFATAEKILESISY